MDHNKITSIKLEIPECDTPPQVLDLSTRKRPQSPNYTLNYPSPKYSPTFNNIAGTCYSARPQSGSDASETSENAHLSDVTRYCTTPPTSTLDATLRPFKAYPNNPPAIGLNGFPSMDPLLGTDSNIAFLAFRQNMLSQLKSNNNETNINMRRNQDHKKIITDPDYVEKRRKNNEAAKRSRDARKAREDEVAIRCAFLEQENIRLRLKIAALEREREILLARK